METTLKKLILRPTGIKLLQDTRAPSKRNTYVLFRCNNRDQKVLVPNIGDTASKVDFITLKGLESTPINIKVYGSDTISSKNLLGELNLLFGALAQEDRTQQEWKQLTKLGRKVGEILIELQAEDKPESDESFYSSQSNPEAVNKGSETSKTSISDSNQEENKPSSQLNSQESPSVDQKQSSEGTLSDRSKDKSDAIPSQGSDNSMVSVESNNQKQASVNIQVEDNSFKPFKGLESLSNGAEFFKTSHTNQDIYLDILEPQEKPTPKKPMGVAKWMIFISQLVNPSLNY